MTDIGDGANYAPSGGAQAVVAPGEFRFAAAHLDHGHVYGQVEGLLAAGGTLTGVYDRDPQRVSAFVERFPQAQPVGEFETLLTDPALHLVAAAAVPSERATIGAQVLRAGKDYFTDKSPFTSLAQLREIESVVRQTGRKYCVYYAERVHNDAAWMAGDLIEQGAVGRVLQVLNLAPHRLAKATRPDWFFDKERYGGILTDIGSHQVEQFLTYAGVADAQVTHARVANFLHPDKPGLEDFGEFVLQAPTGAGFYARVDWHTPQGSPVWGDGRTFVLGSEGTLEVRKYADPARAAPASKLLLTDARGEREIDCLGKSGFPFFGQLILDVLHRTERAMTQAHAFKAAELSMLAQQHADAANPARETVAPDA